MRRSNVYTRREPSKEGKLYYIFCEGESRETTYFYFFNRIATQIILQIVPIEDGKNSPMGLYNNACRCLIHSEDNPNPSYLFNHEDEVWFIIDTDDWGKEILALRENIAKHPNWFVAQSNLCFEVWLYYHFYKDKPTDIVENWKEFLNNVIKGGFNTRKHPVYLEQAIENAENNYSDNGNRPEIFCTEVFHLGKRILPLVQEDIKLLLP